MKGNLCQMQAPKTRKKVQKLTQTRREGASQQRRVNAETGTRMMQSSLRFERGGLKEQWTCANPLFSGMKTKGLLQAPIT